MKDVLNINTVKRLPNKVNYWNDDIFSNYYANYYNSLTSKELDKDFNMELKSLSSAMKQMNENERKVFINLLTSVVEHYIEQKIDKELESSLQNIFKF